MNHTLIFILLVLGLTGFGPNRPVLAKPPARHAVPPNVIFILTDDQGYGDLACLGNPWLKTPNLDRLHAQSVRLTNYHTGTTCSPTRASLMTGQYSNRVGVWHTINGRSLLRPGRSDESEATMADLFRASGYQTAIFGKWHLGDNYPLRPQDRGFNEVLVHGGGGVGQTPDFWGNDYFDDTYLRNGRPEKFQGYCTDVWFSQALRFIEANRKNPFFCYLAINAPHAPYHVPEAYRAAYAANPAVPNPNFYGMIANLDENVGRLVQRLEEWGLAENTILVFTTDNGSAAGAKLDRAGQVTAGYNAGMRGLKGSPYEGGHRVPFFLRYPAGRLGGGRDLPQLTSSLDVLPTLLDLCRIAAPAQNRFDGRALTPLLTGTGQGWPTRTLVVDTQREDTLKPDKPSAVMTDRWRLINGRELYDLPADPAQQRDVAAAFPDTVARLRRAYETWWQDVSQGADEYVRLSVGGPENPAQLTCHDLHPDGNGQAVTAFNQEAVRRGSPALTGFWALNVQAPGRYRISLRRWPVESGMKNSDEAPTGPPVPGGTAYSAGRALPWQRACLKIGEQSMQSAVPTDGSPPVFSVALPKGPTQLRAWFTDAQGMASGIFYVLIEAEKPFNSR